jgi:hypothetical protein
MRGIKRSPEIKEKIKDNERRNRLNLFLEV